MEEARKIELEEVKPKSSFPVGAYIFDQKNEMSKRALWQGLLKQPKIL
jgi:hypothetical protein